QSGTPLLKVTSHYDEQAQTYALTVEQSTEPTHDQPEKLPLHIPFDIELYHEDGEIIPLQCNGKAVSNVLNVTRAKQTFVFEKVTSQP
ncbi:DUF3458 domain-containing protein, partial [Bacillus cereus group sp. Bce032]